MGIADVRQHTFSYLFMGVTFAASTLSPTFVGAGLFPEKANLSNTGTLLCGCFWARITGNAYHQNGRRTVQFPEGRGSRADKEREPCQIAVLSYM